MSDAAIRGENLYRFYHAGDEETLALRGVSLSIEAGEMVAVVGPSGSGKSTLLACLAGLDDPDGGTVYVGQQRLSRRSEGERAAVRRDSIGMLFQSVNLMTTLTVRENVELAQRLCGRFNEPAADSLLERLGIRQRATALPAQLSGGELVRAGLATALANRPRVLLADEPTGEVDSQTEQRVMQVIQDLVQQGLAVLVVTHSRTVAQMAKRVLHLEDGRLSA